MKISLEIEISYDYDDDEGMDWVLHLLNPPDLVLHSNELGESVGEITAVKVLSVNGREEVA